jgi:hypothetical protein
MEGEERSPLPPPPDQQKNEFGDKHIENAVDPLLESDEQGGAVVE